MVDCYMLTHYFKIALRNLHRNRLYAFINTLGMASGMLAVFLIGMFIWGETQVNASLQNKDSHYLLTSQWKDPNMGMEITTLAPIAQQLKEAYPDLVANYYRWDGITSLISKGDRHFRENIQLGDSSMLAMFGFPMLHGDPATALEKPYSVVLTQDMARKFFGKENVVGESLGIQGFSGEKKDFMVTGVLKNLPANSVTALLTDNPNNIFIPVSTYRYFMRQGFNAWNNIYTPSYVELQPGVKPEALEKPLRQLIDTHAGDLAKNNLVIQPIALRDFHLHQNNGLVSRFLWTLAFVGLFILLMAVVNFINIAVSSSAQRTKEIGVRKAIGCQKRQLAFQFLAESVLLAGLSGVLAVLALPVVKPGFEQIVGKSLPALTEIPTRFFMAGVGFVGFMGILAGLYPAFALSSMKVLRSLKGEGYVKKSAIPVRKVLTGFQFFMALVVLSAAVVVTQQVDYFFGQHLGFNKDLVLSAQMPRDWSKKGTQKMQTVKKEFERLNQVSNVALSFEIPNGNSGTKPLIYSSGADSTQAIAMQSLVADENYLNTYRIPLASGVFFEGLGHDSSLVVLNEKAAKTLGFVNPEAAVGQKIRITGDPVVFTVKGVCADFQFGSMQQAKQPMIFFDINTINVYRYLSFRLKPGSDIATGLAAIEAKWKTLLPDSAFEYAFIDESLQKVYLTEIRLKKAAYAAAAFAILIALLGVLGLVSMSIQRRVKEIGIRKVLGATQLSVVGIFIKEFAPVFALACLVACPVAYWVMEKWLSNYAGRIHISLPLMLYPVMVLCFITLTLIVLQTIKAALANPVKSLRSE
jgi:putative ABC transport system permease protein